MWRRINIISGTKLGGKKAAQTNRELYGEDFYRKIGAKGGKNGTTGGFFADRELARRAGALGGRKSKRGAWSAAEKAARLEKIQEQKYIKESLWDNIKKRIKTHG